MRDLLLFLHLAAAIVWMGGMSFLLVALRPVLHVQLQPPVRLPLVAAVLRRFFVAVGAAIVVLLGTGGWLLAAAAARPAGWHAMAAIGVLMMLVFGHIVAGPYRRLLRAVAAQDWAEGGRRMAQVTALAKANFALGWVAIAAVLLWR